MTITPLPDPPQTSDPANFNTDADAFLGALPEFQSELNALAENLASLSGQFIGSSTSSVTVAVGAKSFAATAGLDWQIGQPLMAASLAVPTDYMAGQVTAYDRATGDLTLGVVNANGFDASHSDWSIFPVPATNVLPPFGHIWGLGLSTSGSSASFTVAFGRASDVGGVQSLFTGGFVKTTSAWAAGTGHGGLDTGTIANNTWYHVHLIQKPADVSADVAISLSPIVPVLPTGYTRYRRIGSMKTDGSGHWKGFTQTGDRFVWAAPVVDVNGASTGTTAFSQTLSVPTGIKVEVEYNATLVTSGSNAGILFASPDSGTPSALAGNLSLWANSGENSGQFRTLTNTSAQIAILPNASNTFYIVTQGWIDDRGRNG